MSLLKTSIDSDKDYLKILLQGSTTINASGTPDSDSTFPNDPSAPFGFASSQTVSHNLGYVPLVRAFWDPDKNGRWYNARSHLIDPWLKFIVSTSNLKLIMNTDGSAKTAIPVFYRIYDFNEVAVDSDSLVDKVFKKDSSSGSVSASASSMTLSTTTLTIPHSAGEAPLFSVQFSENQNDWYEAGTDIIGPPDTSSGPPGGPYARFYYTTVFASVTANNLRIILGSNYASSKTIYVRYTLDYRN